MEENIELTAQTFNSDAVPAGGVIPSPAEFTTQMGKVVKGDSAYKSWLRQPGNEGKTEAEYLAWIQQPATDIEAIVAENEADRVVAENARVVAESSRATAETNRTGAESSRVTVESARVTAETARVNAESARATAESGRTTAETNRTSAETARAAAETLRGTAETNRATAETARVNAETARATAENTRSTAETNRSSAETARAAAEALRASAETARVNEWNNTLKPDVLAATEAANGAADFALSNYKTLNVGSAGLVTLSPTTRYFSYRVSVLENMILNIDLQRMISQTGSARCRLIIDMPIVRTIKITNPVLWGGTPPTFASAGQYIFEVIDVDGTGTPLVWQVASTTKAQTTGVIIYVDSTGAVYSTEQINGEIATRTTSTWANPFKYLQNAINAAQSGDIIFIKQGTYKPTHLRTTPTVYAAGDCLDRNATFTMKNGVDVYGGFAGTESKTWQRVVDSQGFPTNQTILSGDIGSEAVIDSAILIGDRRTEASKANAAYNVVTATAITQLTYMNGVSVTYGNANLETTPSNAGGGAHLSVSTILSNVIVSDNSSLFGGGWWRGICFNCKSVYNFAIEGGGWNSSTVSKSTASRNRASRSGGGWILGLSIDCVVDSNESPSGGGWFGGEARRCIAISNRATTGGGAQASTSINSIFICNETTGNGSGTQGGVIVNSTYVCNKGNNAANLFSSGSSVLNCVIFNNKSQGGGITGVSSLATSGVINFQNNAYETQHPTITGGVGSFIDLMSCIQNLTLEQAKIEVPSFVGASTTPEQVAELEAYVANISVKLKPKTGSILRGAGVKRLIDPITPTTDYDGVQRAETPTIGAFE